MYDVMWITNSASMFRTDTGHNSLHSFTAVLLQAFDTSSFASFLTLPSKLSLGKQHLVFETCLPREEKDFGRIHVSNSVTFANSPTQERKMNGSAALCEVHLRQPWE